MTPTTIEEFLKLHANEDMHIFSIESNSILLSLEGHDAYISGKIAPNTIIDFSMTVAEATDPKTGIIVESVTFKSIYGERITLKD